MFHRCSSTCLVQDLKISDHFDIVMDRTNIMIRLYAGLP